MLAIFPLTLQIRTRSERFHLKFLKKSPKSLLVSEFISTFASHYITYIIITIMNKIINGYTEI